MGVALPTHHDGFELPNDVAFYAVCMGNRVTSGVCKRYRVAGVNRNMHS